MEYTSDEEDTDKVRLTIAHLCPDMVLADDAVTKQGVIVLAKNTRLDNVNFSKLSINNVVNVYVWSDSIKKNKKPFVEEGFQQNNPIIKKSANPDKEKREFQRFHLTYRKKINELKNCVEVMKSGGNTSQEELYSIIDSIAATANSKSDIVNYISYLNKMDDFTYAHSINVSLLCNVFARWLELSEFDVEKVSIAGLLHDIGTTSLDLDVKSLLDPEKLTGENLARYKKHSEIGYEILLYQDLSDDIKQAVLMHHERIDGSGYPKGLREKEISYISKIVAICDTYDYWVTIKKKCPFNVMHDFEHEHLGLLCTELLLKFMRNVVYTYTGTYVVLSDDRIAKVVYINSQKPDMPIVSVGEEVIDLSQQEKITIKSMA